MYQQEIDNPYRPPVLVSNVNEAKATMTAADVEINLASTGQRFVNCVIDHILMLVSCMVVVFLIGFIAAMMGKADAFEKALDGVPSLLLGIVIVLFYFVPQEYFSGKTLAKYITKTKVVSDDGGRITFWQAIGRSLGRNIPFEMFSFLSGNGNPVGWHDRVAKTRVISTKQLNLPDRD